MTEPTPPCQPEPRAEADFRFRAHCVSLGVCLLLAIVFTLPKSLAPASGLLGYSGDNFQHAWFLWHFAHAIVDFQNPFHTRLIYYPDTVNLAWSTTDPLAGIIALPVSLMLGPVIAYNVSLILQLALAAFFARLLCLRICRNEAAALIGGLCFGFSPFLLAHALGHLSLVTAFPIPLYFLALDGVLQKRDPRWRDGVYLGLALLLTALAHYDYTVICLLATVVVVLVDLFLAGPALLKRIWRPLGWASAAFLFAFSPLLVILLGNSAEMPRPRPFGNIKQYSADVFGFLIPSWNHIFFGHFARGLDLSVFVAGYEGTVYVGPVMLLLAIVGIWRGRVVERRWAGQAAVLGTIFYLLSLGPSLRFLGHQSSIPGPAALLYQIPAAKFVSAPARFHVIAALCMAILAALGVTILVKRLAKKWERCTLIGGVTLLLLLDLLTIPFPVSSVADPAWPPASGTPPIACILPAALQKGTVITFPLIHWPYSMKSTWMQVSDQGRYALVDGYLSYSPDRVWRDYYRNPILRSLLSIQGEFHVPIDANADRALAASAFRELDASAVVVFDSPYHDAAVRYLGSLLDQQERRAGSCSVFSLDGFNRPPASRSVPHMRGFAEQARAGSPFPLSGMLQNRGIRASDVR